jgi:predicted ATPase
VVAAIVGPAGVGKTSLVIRWAHREAERFPDGHVVINLRGFDDAEPLSTSCALGVLLRALGVPDDDLPTEFDDQVFLPRSVPAGDQVCFEFVEAGQHLRVDLQDGAS